MVTCQGKISRARIEFPLQGVEVAPYEADIRRERRKYAVADFRMSRPAGELINSKVPSASVANVYIGDTLVRRMYYPGDTIEYETSLDEDDVADMMLLDAGRVLERGSINKDFGSVRLDRIVSHILDRRDDPFNVITDYEFIAPSQLDDSILSTGQPAGTPVDPLSPTQVPGESILSNAVLSFFEFMDEHLGTETTEDMYAGFTFEDTTPLSALNQSLEEFELDWWVTNDGILRIGLDPADANAVAVLGDDDSISLSKYAITSDPDKINAVYLEGPYETVREPPERGAEGGLPQENRLQMLAEVRDPTSDGALLAVETERDVESLDELEEIAIRQLTRQMMDQANGSITINGLASESKGPVSALDVGDVIAIDETVDLRCDQDVITGDFIVRGIQQRLSPRQGWDSIVQVAKTPSLDKLDIKSVYYDPLREKEYTSMQQWRDQVFSEQVQE